MLCSWGMGRAPPRLVVALLAITIFDLCRVDGGSRPALSAAGFYAPRHFNIDRIVRFDTGKDWCYKCSPAVLSRCKRACGRISETARGLKLIDDAENPTSKLVGGVVPRNASQQKLKELETWLDDIGVDRGGSGGSKGKNPPSVTLKRFPGRGLGLECTRELERGSTVASIPWRMCLSSDPSDAPRGTLRAWAHSLLASTPPPKCDLDGRKQIAVEEDVASVALQLFLEYAAGERSAFAAWVSMLPLDNDDELNLPALWPADDRTALRGTIVLRDTEECLARAVVEQKWVASALARELETAQEGGNVTTMAGEAEADCFVRGWCSPGSGKDMRGRPGLAEWLRVRCTVQSRAYRVGGRYALIPLVDFANHDDGVAYAVSPGDGVFTGTDEVVLSVDRAYQIGEQVCTTYGDMDNAKRLFSFGFVTLTRLGNSVPSEATRQCSTTSVKGSTTDERCTIAERSRRNERSTGVSSSCVDQSLSWYDCQCIDDGRFPITTEAYCDVELPVKCDDPLRSLKVHVLEDFWRKARDENAGSLTAVFRLDRSPHRPLIMKHLVDEYARPFMESALPLLRLVTLTPEDMRCHNLADLKWCVGLFHNPSSDVAGIGKVSRSEHENKAIMPARLLVRLKCPVSDHNEQQALRFLQVQCSDRLQAIGLNASDVKTLLEVSGDKGQECRGLGLDPNVGYETFVVSRSRYALCATVRVAEAIAWGLLLNACARGADFGTGSAVEFSLFQEQQTFGGWLQQQCSHNSRVCR